MTPGLSEFTRMSRYALRVGNRRETWREQVDRKFGMHEDFYGSRLKDITHPFQSARDMMLDRKVLGSQRALQFGGQPILEKNSRILNCWGSFLCYPRCFQEIFWILLCGGGVGFSVQQHHIAMLPQIRRRSDDAVTYVIPDTIEGWADSLGVLLSSYFVDDQPFPEFAGKKVVFDASGIRAKGAPISSGSLAPGPEPLLRSLVEIERILENLVQPPGGHSVSLRPIQAYDIVMHASDAVLAGGVRRSASIALFSLTDKEMATAKTGNWFFDNPQRQRSNNSALLLRGETTYEQFRELVECTRQDGDPGFFWADNTEIICNPCFAPGTRVSTNKGLIRIEDLERMLGGLEALSDTRADVKSGMVRADVREGPTTLMLPVSNAAMTRKNAAVYEIVTEHGHKIYATDNHRFPTIDAAAGGVVKELRHLAIGDKLLLPNGEGAFGKKASYEMGFLAGLFTGDGTTSGDEAVKKAVPEYIWRGTREAVKGYLQGLFSTDGSAQMGGHAKSATVSLRLSQSNEPLLREVQLLLQQFGVISKIYPRRDAGMNFLPDGRGGMKEYYCKATYELIINRPNCITFEAQIGLPGRKGIQLTRLLDLRGRDCRKPERFITKIVSIEYHSTSDVYCLTQPETNTCVAAGVVAGQCAEITFNPVINVGSSRPIVFNGQDSGIVHHGDGSYSVAGFQACNLSTINGSECRDEEDFIEACSAAAVLGTLQAGYTEFDYLGGYTEQIVEREALLGVSITGMADSPFLFSEELLQAGADEVNRTNALIADSIGIHRASRTTTLKPEGSSSCLLDTASGIHPWHSRRGIRHVREADVSPELRWFKAHNPHAVLPDWGDPNASTEVIGFAYEAPVGAYTKQTTSALDLLEKVRLVQNSWIRHGTHPNRLPYPWLSHNVSNTVNVREHEWDKVARYVYDHRQDFGGVTFLSHSGDKTWRQAPFVAVHTEEELDEIYGYPLRTVLVQLLSELPEELNLWNACDLASQNWQSPEMQDLPLDQFDWVRMLASVVAKEDVDVLIAIKDVYYLQRYDLLTDNYAPVPWKDMLVVEDQNFLEVSACDGGACQIDWARLNAK